MRNITLSADEALIEAARRRALDEHSTLNAAFREWLAEYAQRPQRADAALALVDRIGTYARTGGQRFSRDEMNER